MYEEVDHAESVDRSGFDEEALKHPDVARLPDVAKIPDTARIPDVARIPDAARISDRVKVALPRIPDIPRPADAVKAPESARIPDIPKPADAVKAPESARIPDIPKPADAVKAPESARIPDIPRPADAVKAPESARIPDIPKPADAVKVLDTAEITDGGEQHEAPVEELLLHKIVPRTTDPVRSTGSAHDGSVTTNGIAVTKPTADNVATLVQAFKSNDSKYLEDEINNVNIAFNHSLAAHHLSGIETSFSDPKQGPNFGAAALQEAKDNGLGKFQYYDNVEGSASGGIGPLSITGAYRKGYGVGVPYLKTDALGNTKSYLPVLIDFRTTATVDVSASTAVSSQKTAVATVGGGLENGIQWGIIAEWPWNPQTQRYEPPTEYTYTNGKYEKKYALNDISVYQTSSGRAYVAGAAGVGSEGLINPIVGKAGKAGIAAPSVRAGFTANLQRVDNSIYTYKLSNPSIDTVTGAQVGLNLMPMTGHFLTGGIRIAGTYDGYSHTNVAQIMLVGKEQVGLSAKLPNGVSLGVNGNYQQRIYFDWPAAGKEDAAIAALPKPDAGPVTYFSRPGDLSPTFVSVGSHLYRYDVNTATAIPIQGQYTLDQIVHLDLHQQDPPVGTPKLKVPNWNDYVDGVINEDARLGKPAEALQRGINMEDATNQNSEKKILVLAMNHINDPNFKYIDPVAWGILNNKILEMNSNVTGNTLKKINGAAYYVDPVNGKYYVRLDGESTYYGFVPGNQALAALPDQSGIGSLLAVPLDKNSVGAIPVSISNLNSKNSIVNFTPNLFTPSGGSMPLAYSGSSALYTAPHAIQPPPIVGHK